MTCWNLYEGREDMEGDVKELFTLLRSMLIIDPTRRPSAEEVLKHPWFSHLLPGFQHMATVLNYRTKPCLDFFLGPVHLRCISCMLIFLRTAHP
jgi:serine/threonine protein kinase